MGEIIKHDFGKEDREHARRLANLLQLVKERDEDLLSNPAKYFAMASERLAEQFRLLQDISDALKVPWMVSSEPFKMPEKLEIDIMSIDRRDYEALQAIKALIRSWDNHS